MLKTTAIISLMFIVCSVWAGCDSCGSECTSSCGTRRFRACCFNYLRKKRGPDAFEVHLAQDAKESQQKSNMPVFMVENIPMPERWIANVLPSENHPYSLEEVLENRLD